MKKKEIEEIRAFAIANGFDVQIEEEKPKRGVITKERLDAQQKIDEAEFIKSMYVPPPLEILHRKYTNKEPVRTGFNQGLLSINIKNNIEPVRAPQGPQILVTTSQMRRRERDVSSSTSNRSSSKSGLRSMSRENSINKMELNGGENTAKVSTRGGEMTATDFMKKDGE
jgi:hypothetical protein